MSRSAPQFVHGLELSRAFYTEAVQPRLAEIAPGLSYSAGLIGPGSEVLGYDDQSSTDHHWGPRVMIFCSDQDARALGPAIHDNTDLPEDVGFRGRLRELLGVQSHSTVP